MTRIGLCLWLATLGLAASGDADAPVRRAPAALQMATPRALPALVLSADVKASLERPDAELNAAALRGLTSTDRSRLDRVVSHLRNGNQGAAQREWQSMLQQLGAGQSSPPADINALVQWVVRQSYIETNQDLKSYADKVRHLNEAKQRIRDHLQDVRSAQNAVPADPKATVAFRPMTVKEPALQAERTIPSRLAHLDRAVTLRSPGEVQAHIRKWEQTLSSVGDDAQLANIDLQNVLQHQQQLLQMLSQVSKMLHDTRMAVIRKIGG